MAEIMSPAVKDEVFLICAQISVPEIVPQMPSLFDISSTLTVSFIFNLIELYSISRTFKSYLNLSCFRCQKYMDEISNCLMEGYDVLPSAPENFYFSNVGSTIGLLHWDPPALHGDSVIQYRVHYDESTVSLSIFE